MSITQTSQSVLSSGNLAVAGGKPVRSRPWPARHLFGEEEKRAAMQLFDCSIESGAAFGYNGPEEEAYCREFASFMGGGFADAVNSGTSAVYVALRALDLEPYSEVIVPPITDPGGVMGVPLLNCIPVPADAAPDSFNAGAEQIAQRLNERTSAIVVTHIAGTPCDMDPIMALARARGIPVVEDCAQAHGATYKDRIVGTIGDIAAFSTMFGKHHASGGQGGIVYTRDEQRYWKARRYADRGKPFGLPEATSNVVASHNLNSNELSCAIGRKQLQKLPGIVEARRRFVQHIRYRLDEIRCVQLAAEPDGVQSSYWFLFFKIDLSRIQIDKLTFVRALQAEGLPFDSDYLHSPVLSDWYTNRAVFGRRGLPWTCPLYKGDPNQEYEIPNALAANATHFRLMMHENCGENEARDVVEALRKVESAYIL